MAQARGWQLTESNGGVLQTMISKMHNNFLGRMTSFLRRLTKIRMAMITAKGQIANFGYSVTDQDATYQYS